MTGNAIECLCLKNSIRLAVGTTALIIFVAASELCLHGANLEDNSPFIPDNFNARQQAKKPTAKQPGSSALDFEFRGVYSLGGEYQFSIYNKKAQKGQWVSLGETGSSYQVTGFDEDSNSIELTIDGKTEEITLRAPDNKPIPVQTASATPKRSRAELAAANRAARAKQKRPVVRRRVIVPNRKVPAASQAQNQAKPVPQTPRFPANTQRRDYKPPRDAEELMKELQIRRSRSRN